MIDAYRLLKVSCAATLFLGVLTVILGNSNVQEVLLRPPGLRPVKDPSIVIPFDQLYPNQPPNLPRYRDASGQPVKGWVRKYVGTRRFFSDQSALIYYRVSDLAQSKIIQASKAEKALHIWPVGTVIILESYKGDVNSAKSAKFLEIDAIEKKNDPDSSAASSFFPVNWSYARFTPEGKPSITSQKARECHQCHSIAFHVTGDLVFSPFP